MFLDDEDDLSDYDTIPEEALVNRALPGLCDNNEHDKGQSIRANLRSHSYKRFNV